MFFSTISLALGLNAAMTLALPLSAENIADSPINERSSIWQPTPGSTWQIMLENPLDPSKPVVPNVDIWDLDLFDNAASTISMLRSAPLNKRVICYFSAGTYEPGRPDSSQFLPSDKGSGVEGWAGERWLNLQSTNVRNIMVQRLKLAASKGCDAVDPDNVDAYDNDNGLGLTMQNSIDYINFLAAEAASLGLAIGLKNAGDVVAQVLPNVQFAVNEQCIQYKECALTAPFIQAGKAVLHIEYPSKVPNVSSANIAKYCASTGKSGAAGFSTVLQKLDLNGIVEYCDGTKAATAFLDD